MVHNTVGSGLGRSQGQVKGRIASGWLIEVSSLNHTTWSSSDKGNFSGKTHVRSTQLEWEMSSLLFTLSFLAGRCGHWNWDIFKFISFTRLLLNHKMSRILLIPPSGTRRWGRPRGSIYSPLSSHSRLALALTTRTNEMKRSIFTHLSDAVSKEYRKRISSGLLREDLNQSRVRLVSSLPRRNNSFASPYMNSSSYFVFSNVL